MIVQVWRRAREAAVGPGGRRLCRAGDRRGGARGRRRGRADRSGPALRHRPDLRRPAERSIPSAASSAWSTCRVICLRSIPAAVSQVLEPLEALGTDMATLANATEDEHERARPQRGQGRGQLRPCAPRARPRPLLHPRHRPHRPRPGLAPYRHLRLHPRRRWSGSPPCRRARSSSASGWSSCGRWSTA